MKKIWNQTLKIIMASCVAVIMVVPAVLLSACGRDRNPIRQGTYEFVNATIQNEDLLKLDAIPFLSDLLTPVLPALADDVLPLVQDMVASLLAPDANITEDDIVDLLMEFIGGLMMSDIDSDVADEDDMPFGVILRVLLEFLLGDEINNIDAFWELHKPGDRLLDENGNWIPAEDDVRFKELLRVVLTGSFENYDFFTFVWAQVWAGVVGGAFGLTPVAQAIFGNSFETITIDYAVRPIFLITWMNSPEWTLWEQEFNAAVRANRLPVVANNHGLLRMPVNPDEFWAGRDITDPRLYTVPPLFEFVTFIVPLALKQPTWPDRIVEKYNAWYDSSDFASWQTFLKDNVDRIEFRSAGTALQFTTNIPTLYREWTNVTPTSSALRLPINQVTIANNARVEADIIRPALLNMWMQTDGWKQWEKDFADARANDTVPTLGESHGVLRLTLNTNNFNNGINGQELAITDPRLYNLPTAAVYGNRLRDYRAERWFGTPDHEAWLEFVRNRANHHYTLSSNFLLGTSLAINGFLNQNADIYAAWVAQADKLDGHEYRVRVANASRANIAAADITRLVVHPILEAFGYTRPGNTLSNLATIQAFINTNSIDINPGNGVPQLVLTGNTTWFALIEWYYRWIFDKDIEGNKWFDIDLEETTSQQLIQLIWNKFELIEGGLFDSIVEAISREVVSRHEMPSGNNWAGIVTDNGSSMNEQFEKNGRALLDLATQSSNVTFSLPSSESWSEVMEALIPNLNEMWSIIGGDFIRYGILPGGSVFGSDLPSGPLFENLLELMIPELALGLFEGQLDLGEDATDSEKLAAASEMLQDLFVNFLEKQQFVQDTVSLLAQQLHMVMFGQIGDDFQLVKLVKELDGFLGLVGPLLGFDSEDGEATSALFALISDLLGVETLSNEDANFVVAQVNHLLRGEFEEIDLIKLLDAVDAILGVDIVAEIDGILDELNSIIDIIASVSFQVQGDRFMIRGLDALLGDEFDTINTVMQFDQILFSLVDERYVNLYSGALTSGNPIPLVDLLFDVLPFVERMLDENVAMIIGALVEIASAAIIYDRAQDAISIEVSFDLGAIATPLIATLLDLEIEISASLPVTLGLNFAM